MSELNSSENNSVSENNNNSISEDSASNQMSSPSSQKLETFDDCAKRSGDLESNFSNREFDLINGHDLISLPIMLSQTDTSNENTIKRMNFDTELCGLLNRKQPKFIPQAPKCAKCNLATFSSKDLGKTKTFFSLYFADSLLTHNSN